jgi:3-oxoacyl-[acyl-carrier protein] reductase
VGRLGQPTEFTALVSFLVSEQASYLTGATIDLNGGSRMA